MKLCRFVFNKEVYNGIVEDEFVRVISDLKNLRLTANVVELSKIQFLPPVTPSKIVCVGRNYAQHAAELGNSVPKEPLLFLKAPSSIISDKEDIQIPHQSTQVEHEGELGIVIGRDCKNLGDFVHWQDYVSGYICLNDVTARDLQRSDVQFTRAKSFDTFCPIGSFIETDLDVSDLRVTTKVNGVVKQDGRTSQMVFSVPFLIKYISNQMTLKAGDIVATGTPSGVSKLSDGDICEVEIEGIGILRNTVRNAIV